MTINERVKEIIGILKNQKKINNVQQFANKIGVDKSYISKIIHDKTSVTDKFCQKIVKSYPEISYKWLISNEGDMVTNSEKENKIPNENPFDIKKIVKYIVYKENCTQNDIAKRVGVKNSYLSDVINGRYPLSKKLENKFLLRYPHIFSKLYPHINSENISSIIQTNNTTIDEPEKFCNDIHHDIDFYKGQITSLTEIIREQQVLISSLMKQEFKTNNK